MAEDKGRASADSDVSETGSRLSPGARRRYRVALVITVAVVVAVLALLPTALVSMVGELRGQSATPVFDLFTGAPIDAEQAFAGDAAYVNVAVTNLEEGARLATLTVSGHRVCRAVCPAITGTFYSLGSDTARRLGLPPSASGCSTGPPSSSRTPDR